MLAAMASTAQGSWLPDELGKDQVRPIVCQYDGSTLVQAVPFIKGEATVGSLEWSCKKRAASGVQEYTFTLRKGTAKDAGIAVAFDFANWSRENYVLVPAAVYNGNRFNALGGDYMPPYPREMFFDLKLPMTISNNPRLSIEPGQASKIELLTGNAATPAFSFYSPKQKRGWILLCEQRSRFGNNGLIIQENAAQDRISFIVNAPGVRVQAAGFGGFRPSGDKGADFNEGDTVTLRFKVIDFRAKSIPELLQRFFAVRKSLTDPNQPRDLVPFSYAHNAITKRFKERWREFPVGGYYLPENSPDFQLGWVSGFMQTPLLAMDEARERERMLQQMDFVVGKLQGKGGFFYGGITSTGKLREDRSLDGRLFALTRKNADTLAMFMKQFLILKRQRHESLIKKEWAASARRLADAFVSMWRKYGEFGQYIDPETSEIAVYNSTCGAVVPGALALASEWFGEKAYLDVAKESALFYYKRDVEAQGMTSGHCTDTSQDPDSDSTFGFLESLMTLYAVTGDKLWLEKAKVQAALASTWVLSYDHVFPPESHIGKLGCHMAGAVWASAQNKHAAPGICTSSGDSLFKLFRATGDRRFAELLRDIQHAHTEATEWPGHRTTGTGIGASMERIQSTDGEGKEAIGNFIETQNAWCELDGLMMVTEIPGIYVRTDKPVLFTFDHVSARILDQKSGQTTIEIVNKTPYDAKVTVFAEDAKAAKRPMRYADYLGWKKVSVPAGGKVRVTIGSLY